jgi:hypothetical protein
MTMRHIAEGVAGQLPVLPDVRQDSALSSQHKPCHPYAVVGQNGEVWNTSMTL